MSVEQLNLFTGEWEDVDSSKWISEGGVKKDEKGKQSDDFFGSLDGYPEKDKTDICGTGNQLSRHNKPP